jgi:hypothetical protein
MGVEVRPTAGAAAWWSRFSDRPTAAPAGERSGRSRNCRRARRPRAALRSRSECGECRLASVSIAFQQEGHDAAYLGSRDRRSGGDLIIALGCRHQDIDARRRHRNIFAAIGAGEQLVVRIGRRHRDHVRIEGTGKQRGRLRPGIAGGGDQDEACRGSQEVNRVPAKRRRELRGDTSWFFGPKTTSALPGAARRTRPRRGWPGPSPFGGAGPR